MENYSKNQIQKAKEKYGDDFWIAKPNFSRGKDMNITKQIWEEFDSILSKYKIPYTSYNVSRDVQKVMEYPDITIQDKYIQINLVIPNYYGDS